MTLFALAMNENLSAEEFNRLSERHLNNKAMQLEIIADNLVKLPPEQRARYLSSAMQIYCMS